MISSRSKLVPYCSLGSEQDATGWKSWRQFHLGFRASEVFAKVLFDCASERFGIRVWTDEESFPQFQGITHRKRRALEKRPALAQKSAVGLDQNRLYGCLRKFRNQPKPQFE